MRVVAFGLALVLALAPSSVLAGSASAPEVEDPAGDVNAQHFVDTGLLNGLDELSEETEMAGDIVKAWVHGETEDAFEATVELDALPSEGEIELALPEVWLHVSVQDTVYHVRTGLELASSGGLLEAEHELYQHASPVGMLSGTVDADAGQITVTLPKASVGSPQPGDRLTQMHASTHLEVDGQDGLVLDYAPDAEAVDPTELDDPTQLDPSELGLGPELSYGQAYMFGDFQGASDVTVDASPDSLELQAGESGQAALTVANQGDAQDTVTVQAGQAPAGWNIDASPAQVPLGPGQSQQVIVTVAAPQGASGQHLILMEAAPGLGSSALTALSVTVHEAQEDPSEPDPNGDNGSETPQDPAPGDDGEDADGDEPGGEPGDDDGQNGAPGPGLAGLIAALTASVALSRRRA